MIRRWLRTRRQDRDLARLLRNNAALAAWFRTSIDTDNGPTDAWKDAR